MSSSKLDYNISKKIETNKSHESDYSPDISSLVKSTKHERKQKKVNNNCVLKECAKKHKRKIKNITNKQKKTGKNLTMKRKYSAKNNTTETTDTTNTTDTTSTTDTHDKPNTKVNNYEKINSVLDNEHKDIFNALEHLYGLCKKHWDTEERMYQFGKNEIKEAIKQDRMSSHDNTDEFWKTHVSQHKTLLKDLMQIKGRIEKHIDEQDVPHFHWTVGNDKINNSFK